MTDRVLYLDSSAIVKLIVTEPESGALIGFFEPGDITLTSRIAAVEVRRAVARRGEVDIMRVEAVLARVRYRELDDDLAVRASGLAPIELRTLDAIHVASAIDFRRQLHAFITYDDRLADAARRHGLPVAAPGT